MLTVGHRGLMAAEPENTLRSFRRAAAEGVDVVELDLHLSRDGELVVLHDATLDRTTDGSGPVSAFTLEELRGLDAGQGERIPVFADVARAVSTPVQAEIKDRAAARVLAEQIGALGLHGRVRAISFHEEALREVRSRLPHLDLALVADDTTATAPERALALGVGMVSCEFGRLTSAVVERAHAAGLEVIAWTVNSGEELARARTLGLDGVVTDRPEIVRALSPVA